jgi:gas vesicle protein
MSDNFSEPMSSNFGETNSSHLWTYVIAGSAIGGAVGYLFATDAGRKVRRTITHPQELSVRLEDAGQFVESKARVITDRVHDVLFKVKSAIEEGQTAYRDAGRQYQYKTRQIEVKNGEVTSTVHKTVDDLSQAAARVEHSVLDPICELGALYRGFESGLRTIFGSTAPAGMDTENDSGPVPVYPDTRAVGS